jgi:hypothetical protein
MRITPPAPGATRLRRGLAGGPATVLLAAVLTACGDDTAASDATAPTEPASASPSESASPSPSRSATPSSSPSDPESEPAGPTLEVRVTGDSVTPVAEQVDLAVGERLTITVRSDRAGELHVHSDPEHSFDFMSGTEKFHLTLDTPGSVDIEEHVSDALVARVLVR